MDTTTGRPAAGERLGGRYVLDAPIGRGGAGVVWRATDEVLGREVAVKVLRSDVTLHPSIRRSLEREGRHAAVLTSAGIPVIHDLGDDDGLPYLVMELVRGESLAERLRREGPLPVDTAVGLAVAAAEAVEAVHRAGIVHRDVKPANLLLGDDERVRLTDFGIAGRSDPDAVMTDEVTSLGTVPYVAPERARGDDPGPASDVYSLGIVTYELLVGHPPFQGDPAAVLLAQVSALPPPLPTSVPAGVRSAITRALQKDPTARHGSAVEFAAELRAGLEGALATPPDGSRARLAEDAATAPLPVIAGRGHTTVLPSSAPGAMAILPTPALGDREPAARRPGDRRRGVVMVGLFGLVLLAIAALALAAADGDAPSGPEIVPTVSSPDPIPAEVEPTPTEPVPDTVPAPPARENDRGGNGNGRGGRNGNGRGGRGG